MVKRTAAKAEEGPYDEAKVAPDLIAAEEAGLQRIKIARLEIVRLNLVVVGETPLLMHKWSEKAKLEMANKGGPAEPKSRRPKRDLLGDYEAARYILPKQDRDDGCTDGVMAVAFKAAIVHAARAFENVTMTQLKQFIFVEGEPPELLVPIHGTPEYREDMVRVGKGLNKTADIRARPQYWPWSVNLSVRFPSAVFDVDSIASLVAAGGLGGVGEWRPTSPQSMTGQLGMFRIDESKPFRGEIVR